MSKFIKEVIGQDYKKWSKGDLILLEAGTGRGKTSFIKEEFNTYCRENNKNILYLTNRNLLKKQVKNDIYCDDTNAITVINYQEIEKKILNNTKFDNYDYVVMDEAHYFFSDSGFNCKTDLFFKKMIEDKSICKILMTATPVEIKFYFNKNNIKIDYDYSLATDYGYLKEIVAFNTYKTIDAIIRKIPKDEQIIFFSSAQRALEVAQKYKGAFICSKNNKKGFAKYISLEEEENIINTGEFKNHILCCTTALDNGINLKENSNLKHIIIDVFDKVEFIQCLGRKRIAEGEQVNLYFYSYKDNKQINGFKRRIVNSLEMAEFLMEHGEVEFVKHKFKSENFADTRIIDDVIGSDKEIHKVVNQCVYTKYRVDLLMYESILKYKNKYKNIIALALGIKKGEIIEMEVSNKKSDTNKVLEREVGRRLYKEDREKLIEFIGLKDARGRLQKSINLLNAYFKENNIKYTIISKKIKENKKLNTVWVIENLVIEQ